MLPRRSDRSWDQSSWVRLSKLFEIYRYLVFLKYELVVASVVDPDPDPYPDWIRIQWCPWIRIRIRNPDPDPGGQK
jgi:hypothetical protein